MSNEIKNKKSKLHQNNSSNNKHLDLTSLTSIRHRIELGLDQIAKGKVIDGEKAFEQIGTRSRF